MTVFLIAAVALDLVLVAALVVLLRALARARLASGLYEAEEAARVYNAALRSAMSAPGFALLGWDTDYRLCIVEGGIYNYTEAPLVGSSARDLFRAYSPRSAEAFDRVVDGEADTYDVTDPRTGRIYHVRARPNLVPGAGYAFVVDVTEDRAREAELDRLRAEAERRYERTVDRSAEEIVRQDIQRRYANV